VLRHRTGRAAGALTVVAVTAFSPTGVGFVPAAHAQAIGTVIGAGSVNSTADEVSPPAADDTLHVTGSAPLVDTSSTDTATVVATPTPTGTATATGAIVPPSAPTGSGIPATVLAAYKKAEAGLAASDPGCHVSWSLLAGIGRVESGNASGGRVDAAGTTNGRILGPRLDGTNSTVVIHDTDGGALDGDTTFDRAVGPMQFIPGTWKTFGKDGNGDGVASPHNVFDAALAAGSYLCAGGSDLSQPVAQRAALLRYNRSVAYGDLVLRWAAAYAAGVSVLPNGTGQVPTTTPTPPAQVPAPASGALDPATSAALAAPAPTVSGSVASESSAGSSAKTSRSTSTTTTTTTTPTTKVTTTTPTSTTTAPVTTSSSTTTTTTTTPTTPSVTTSPTSTTPTSVVTSSSAAGSGSSGSSSSASSSDSARSSTTKTSTSKKTSTTTAAKSSAAKSSTTKTSTTKPTTSAAKITTGTSTN
jgi:membrane-bound lytic murein transglycosylase B